jgi:hypothetical protein
MSAKVQAVNSVKDPVKRKKRYAIDWEKIFVKHVSDNEHSCRM